MAAYITITDAETDPEAPLTSELAKKWRDNPIAIAGQDTTVPLGLRLGYWLLGSVNTTSGTSVSLSGLDLSEYKFIVAVLNGLSTTNAGSSNFLLAGVSVATAAFGSAGAYGFVWINLANSGNSVGAFSCTENKASGSDSFNVNTTSTSISVSLTAGNFDAGSVKFYGVR